jgi:transcriptional regulator with XRE-family HTH domain
VDADRIRRLREDIGLTQGQLADRAGISRTSLVRIESGSVRWCTAATTNAIARELGVGRRELLANRDTVPA